MRVNEYQQKNIHSQRLIGAVIYYICLRLEVRKQNRMLEKIKRGRKGADA